MRFAIIFLILMGLGCSKKTEFQLPGGSKAVLVKSSFGTNHAVHGTFFRKLSEFSVNQLPPSLWKYLPEAVLPRAVSQSLQPRLVVFFRTAVPNPHGNESQFLVKATSSSFVVGYLQNLDGHVSNPSNPDVHLLSAHEVQGGGNIRRSSR